MLDKQNHDSSAVQSVNSGLPDVAVKSTLLPLQFPLSRVGMSHIQVPILYTNATTGGMRSAADVDAYVSLDQVEARGIHMSRLFTLLQESLPVKPLSVELLKQLTQGFLESHQGLSKKAEIFIRWSLLLQRKALKSENFGWRSYPVAVFAEQNGTQFNWGVEFQVLYSSTCPASAALSRDLIQSHFREDFRQATVSSDAVQQWLGTSAGVLATPHAQRSIARVKLVLSPEQGLNLQEWIDQVEEVLQTPVQTSVKRSDEQEFALRNGQNLMFCEDANRRIQSVMSKLQQILAYRIEVRHLESLHPHDAVSLSQMGELADFLIPINS